MLLLMAVRLVGSVTFSTSLWAKNQSGRVVTPACSMSSGSSLAGSNVTVLRFGMCRPNMRPSIWVMVFGMVTLRTRSRASFVPPQW